MSKIIIAGSLNVKGWHRKANEVLDGGGISTCIHCQSNNLLQKIIENMDEDLTVKQRPHGFNKGFEYTEGICPTITKSSWEDNNFIKMAERNQNMLPAELQGKKFRIRKLTPRECFRLMGVDETDIDKIQAAGISNSGTVQTRRQQHRRGRALPHLPQDVHRDRP